MPPANLPTPSTETTLESPRSIAKSIDHRRFETRGPANEAVSEVLPRVPRAASAPLLDHREDCRVVGNPGFLGSTSYSSIFAESLSKLGVVSADLEETHASVGRTFWVPGDRITRGCQILNLFKDQYLINRFVERWLDTTGGCGVIVVVPIVRRWLSLLWRDHGNVLKEQHPEKIRRLSELLWRNTPTHLVYDGNTSAQKWAEMGS